MLNFKRENTHSNVKVRRFDSLNYNGKLDVVEDVLDNKKCEDLSKASSWLGRQRMSKYYKAKK